MNKESNKGIGCGGIAYRIINSCICCLEAMQRD